MRRNLSNLNTSLNVMGMGFDVFTYTVVLGLVVHVIEQLDYGMYYLVNCFEF